ncbi:relaxase domain-containing protein [Micrococcus terreus]|uniref:MobF family relaxase n=1 Tax=Micrococcus terreus TaxID=574650 RepID=UPI0021A70EAB|nr:MobF family relaxase [Micrococcus terreus]MCT2089736.1 relaxase domain-containing protein [Micrococcus terreus]
MTVSISQMTISYYLDSAATGDLHQGGRKDLTSYYTEAKAPPGRWLGSGLAGLSLDPGQQVTRRDAVAIYEEVCDPGTGQHLGRPPMTAQTAPAGAKTPAGRTAKSERKPVAGFDLTFSVPKSVSTLWAMAGPALQGQIQAAHEQAMSETLAWVEANVLQSRAGHAGVAHVPVTGLVASAFDHWDSRAGDPQLHTHLVISNRVQRVMDGQWATIDSYTLHRHVVAISETYNSLLFDRLHQQVGALPESRSGLDQRIEDVLAAAGAADTDATAPQSTHRVELAGVPDSLIEEFSTRARDIQVRKDELIADWQATHGRTAPAAIVLQLRQQATLETRTPKDTGPAESLAVKMVGWRERAVATGHTPATVVANAVGHTCRTITSEQLTEPVLDQLATWVLQDTAQRRTTFTRANVVASAERITRLVRYRTAQDRHTATGQLVDRALSQGIALTEQRSILPETASATVANRGTSVFDHQRKAGLWTTRQAMDDEAYLMGRTTTGHAPRLDPDTVTGHVASVTTASGHPLSADQAAAAAHALASERSLEAIIGPAGTGKTTTMAAVATLWSQKFGSSSVVGLAPSAVAAGVLGDELGVDTDNTSKWLYESVGDGAARRAARVEELTARLDRAYAQRPGRSRTQQIEQLTAQLAQQYAEQARFTLHQDQLLIVDEASMVSTSQLAELARQAEQAGAKVLLVGDPAQLEAVDAGGFLGWMDREADPARLDMVWRFRNEWEREASLQLRRGDPDVLQSYAEHDRIHGDPEQDATDQAYQAWMADRRAGSDSILIASDNATVAELNTRAQAELVDAGQVDVESTVTLRSDVEAGVGDIILARRNDRSLRDTAGAFIANGTRLQITTINPDGSVVARNESNQAELTLDPDYLASSTELGYATTAHRSQGVTVDTAHAVVGPGLSRELFYVAMTRGRAANHAYVELADHQDTHSPDRWGLMHEQPGAENPVAALGAVLKRSSAERTAHEVKAQQHAWATDLGRMLHELEYLKWADRAQRTHQWVKEHYGQDEQALAQLTDATTWSRLVNLDPAQNYQGNPTPGDGLDQITLNCAPSQDQPPLTVPDALDERIEPVFTDLVNRIETATRAQIAALEADPPEWYEPLRAAHPDLGSRRRAAQQVLTWRAVSEQTEATEPLGTAPTEAIHQPYFTAARAALESPRLTTDQQHQERVVALTQNWVDFSALEPRASTPSTCPSPHISGPGQNREQDLPTPDSC